MSCFGWKKQCTRLFSLCHPSSRVRAPGRDREVPDPAQETKAAGAARTLRPPAGIGESRRSGSQSTHAPACGRAPGPCPQAPSLLPGVANSCPPGCIGRAPACLVLPPPGAPEFELSLVFYSLDSVSLICSESSLQVTQSLWGKPILPQGTGRGAALILRNRTIAVFLALGSGLSGQGLSSLLVVCFT